MIPLVSILIRTYAGRHNLLTRALKSVAVQSYENLEIVVVEDGGNACLDAVLRLKEHFPQLNCQHVGLPKVGRCLAGNEALRIAKGTYCNFLDDDDEFYPEHVRYLVNALESVPNAKAVIARSHELPSEVISLDPLVITENEAKPFKHIPFSRWALWNSNVAPIQAVMFDRALYSHFGGFDPSMSLMEDWDLWVRYLSSGNIVELDTFTSFFRTPSREITASQRQKNLTSIPVLRDKSRTHFLSV